MKNMMLSLTVLLGLGCGQGAAVDNAHEWANRHFPGEVRSIDCVDGINADTDGNGYVSCTVFFNTAQPPLAIECATGRQCQSGCRVSKQR